MTDIRKVEMRKGKGKGAKEGAQSGSPLLLPAAMLCHSRNAAKLLCSIL